MRLQIRRGAGRNDEARIGGEGRLAAALSLLAAAAAAATAASDDEADGFVVIPVRWSRPTSASALSWHERHSSACARDDEPPGVRQSALLERCTPMTEGAANSASSALISGALQWLHTAQ